MRPRQPLQSTSCFDGIGGGFVDFKGGGEALLQAVKTNPHKDTEQIIAAFEMPIGGAGRNPEPGGELAQRKSFNIRLTQSGVYQRLSQIAMMEAPRLLRPAGWLFPGFASQNIAWHAAIIPQIMPYVNTIDMTHPRP